MEARAATDPAQILQALLAILTDLTVASHGYIEIFSADACDAPRAWFAARGLSGEDLEHVRPRVSRGIIAQSISSGSVLVTPAAFLDPRFDSFASLAREHLGAVLCAPVGTDPPVGVLYLYGGREGTGFSDADVALITFVASELAALAEQLARDGDRTTNDLTQQARLRLGAHDIVGQSAALARFLEQVAMVASLDISVLFTGESGTGKSQLARVLHENSHRKAFPFVEVNCAALPDTLLESELFGAMAGAHSTAERSYEGKVHAAERGTLFLDEVAELTPAA